MQVFAARHRVILDTDPGVDDAVALYFALAHPDIDLVGITTTFGNVSVAQASANALYLTRIAGYTVPVAQGVSTPLVKAPGKHPDFIHGRDGLGNLPHRVAVNAKIEPRCAAEFIVDQARCHPGEITLVAVGPLGNLARALELAPDLPALLKQVVIMGGTIDEPGNVSPVAEANAWNDPHAADRVFSAGWDLTMTGLDVTHRVFLPSAMFAELARHHAHLAMETLNHAVAFYSDFCSAFRPGAVHGCYGHDVLALVRLVAPDLFGTRSGRIRVATDGIGNGQTMMAHRPGAFQQSGWPVDLPETRACMRVDAAACAALIDATLRSDWLRPALVETLAP